MKKQRFYSLVNTQGEVTAMAHEGYTDGRYNYYKNGCSWFAIQPDTGLSVAQYETRRETSANANHSRTVSAIEKVKRSPDWEMLTTRFNTLCAAQEA